MDMKNQLYMYTCIVYMRMYISKYNRLVFTWLLNIFSFIFPNMKMEVVFVFSIPILLAITTDNLTQIVNV